MSTLARGVAAGQRRHEDVEGLRHVHLGMIDAVLAGGGVTRVAAIAAEHLDGPVAIVLPGAGLAALEPKQEDRRLGAMRRYVADRLVGRPTKVPEGVVAEVAVRSGEDAIGTVALLDAEDARGAIEVLQLAALAALTVVSLDHDPTITHRRARAGLLDDLHSDDPPPAAEVVARARQLGCDLTEGTAALCVKPAAGGAERVIAAIAEEFPTALAVVRGDHVEVLLPAVADTAGADSVALRLARRLRQAAPTGLTPFHRDAGALPRLLRAAEIAMLLGERDGLEPHELLTGSWRLLVHVAAEDAGQLDALVESTVGPAVAHDAGSGLGLIDTLRAYLARRANMRATAAAVYAHRHTVAARLDRIRELTGHDPQAPLGQQQLSLGLQALAVATAAAGVER